MAKNQTLFVTATANNKTTSFANADGTTAKSIITVGANGSILNDIIISSSDTANQTFILLINTVEVARFVVPLGTGNGTVSSTTVGNLVSGLFKFDNAGNRIIKLEAADTVTIQLSAGAVTAGKTVTFYAKSEDF
jgi:hypothetical protein